MKHHFLEFSKDPENIYFLTKLNLGIHFNNVLHCTLWPTLFPILILSVAYFMNHGIICTYQNSMTFNGETR